VTWAEFEEKEYETACNVELGSRWDAVVLSPGQVLEAIVGYDVATEPGRDAEIWRILRLERPKGLRLLPGHWDGDLGRQPFPSELPKSPISLVIQYKRPEYIRGSRGAQWRLWSRPYFRFTRSSRQHRVLKRLEQRMGPEALVRYAAPAFWLRGDLEAAHLARTVLRRSGFVAPSVLGNHRVWTYIEPGLDGRGNPSGGWQPFEVLEALLDFIRIAEPTETNLVLAEEPLFAHLRSLAAAAMAREPTARARVRRWQATLREAGVAEPTIERLVNYAAVVDVLGSVGATWRVVDRNRPASLGPVD
jgi:hypothetical protein